MLKKLFAFFFTVSVFVCQEAFPQARPKMDRTVLNISAKSVDFSCDGGTKVINVNSGSDWRFSIGDNTWCRVEKTKTGIKINAVANDASSRRTTTINITNGKKSEKVLVTQAATEIPFSNTESNDDSRNSQNVLQISTTKVDFDAKGGSKSITVSGVEDWEISVRTAHWVRLNTNGNKITLTVDENNSTNPRKDYFVIQSGIQRVQVDISQEKSQNQFFVSKNELSFDGNGGERSITVTSTMKWSVSNSTASWGHLNINGNVINISVDKNNTGSPRTDYILLMSGGESIRIGIFQDKIDDFISVTPNEVSFDGCGGSKSLAVSSTKEWKISISPAPWIKLAQIGNQVVLNVDTNESESLRSDYFILKSGSETCRVNIVQYGTERYISVSNDNIKVNPKRHTETVKVQSNGDWYITGSHADWVDLKKSLNSLDLKIKRNRSRDGRSDYFVIKSGTITQRVDIYQSGRGTSWLFRKESDFSSHFLDLQIGADLNPRYNQYFMGGSYTFVPAHIGFRISAMSDVSNVKGSDFSKDKWLLSMGPIIRFTSDEYRLDFQAFVCPALYNNKLAWDCGLRFGWQSINRLSLWDFTTGVMLLENKVIPTIGLGAGVATSPLIGTGALIFDDLNNNPNQIVPHYFLDCNFSILNKEVVLSGISFDCIPDRIGFHSSLWKVDDIWAVSLGMNYRLFKPERLYDLQLYGGVGLTNGIEWNNGGFWLNEEQIVCDFGARINFESNRDFSWYDITIGGLYVCGHVIPTIGCGLCLSSLVCGVGYMTKMIK